MCVCGHFLRVAMLLLYTIYVIDAEKWVNPNTKLNVSTSSIRSNTTYLLFILYVI